MIYQDRTGIARSTLLHSTIELISPCCLPDWIRTNITRSKFLYAARCTTGKSWSQMEESNPLLLFTGQAIIPKCLSGITGNLPFFIPFTQDLYSFLRGNFPFCVKVQARTGISGFSDQRIDPLCYIHFWKPVRDSNPYNSVCSAAPYQSDNWLCTGGRYRTYFNQFWRLIRSALAFTRMVGDTGFEPMLSCSQSKWE